LQSGRIFRLLQLSLVGYLQSFCYFCSTLKVVPKFSRGSTQEAKQGRVGQNFKFAAISRCISETVLARKLL